MPDERSAEDIQRDIEHARVSLAQAVDQIAYRTSPKRATEKITAKLQTPAGKAAIGGAGALVVVLVVLRVRKNSASKQRTSKSRRKR